MFYDQTKVHLKAGNGGHGCVSFLRLKSMPMGGANGGNGGKGGDLRLVADENVSDLRDYSHEAVRDYALSDFELLYYSEGTTSVVTVARGRESGNIWLANNGKVDASSQEDLQTQLLLGHLLAPPPRLRGDPERIRRSAPALARG